MVVPGLGWEADDDRIVAFPFHGVGIAAGNCDGHNAGAARVAPQLGVPSAHGTECSTPSDAAIMLVVDF